MLNTRSLDELAARIGQVFENSPAKDIEKQMKQLLTNGLARLDVVPRAEFDVQAQVLLRTREKLEAMERRLAELEARVAPGVMAGPGAMSAAGPMGGPGAMGGPGSMGPGSMGPGAMGGPALDTGTPGMGGPGMAPGDPGLAPGVDPTR